MDKSARAHPDRLCSWSDKNSFYIAFFSGTQTTGIIFLNRQNSNQQSIIDHSFG